MLGERSIKKIALAVFAVMLGGLNLPRPLFAALSCTVSTACPSGTVVLNLWSPTGNHAELPTQSNYPNLICCSGVSGLGNSCSGNSAVVVRLARPTNSHVETNASSDYAQTACLSASVGTVTVGYQNGNCNGFDTTVGSISAASNAHMGDAGAYPLKVCASITPPVVPPPVPGGGGGGLSGGSGGGGLPQSAQPPNNAWVYINSGANQTTSLTVHLALFSDSATTMQISNTPDFAGGDWEPYMTTKDWSLLPMGGQASVYVKFKNSNGVPSNVVTASIAYRPQGTTSSTQACTSQPTRVYFTFAKTLRVGMTDPDVAVLQKMLNAQTSTRVASSGPGSPGHETNTFGAQTRLALMHFQQGADPSGIFSGETLVRANALIRSSTIPGTYQDVSSCASSTSSALHLAQIIFKKNLKSGQTDADVISLQAFLNANSFTVAKSGVGSPGKETSFFGGATAKALRVFQAKYLQNKISKKEFGVLGAATRAFINGLK